MSTPAVVKAKRFLVNRIVDQAKRANVPLSEAETHMLGFSPVSPARRSTRLRSVFERDFDKGKYEAKISRLFQDVYRGGQVPRQGGDLGAVARRAGA